MASSSLFEPNSLEAITANIEARHASLIQEISRTRPEIRDRNVYEEQVERSKQYVLQTLYNDGFKDPSKVAGSNLVAWRVDRDLWERLGPGSPFPFLDARPDGYEAGPPSVMLWEYQWKRRAGGRIGA